MNLQGLIASPQCPRQHSIKTYEGAEGAWVRGDDELFVLLIQGDRRYKYRLQCRECGKRSSDLPKVVAEQWELLAKQYPFDLIDIRPANSYPDCTFRDCPEPGQEWHHFAPRNTFGADADNWPVLPLCRTHHLQWHQAMNGYRWHRRTEVAA